MQSSTFLLYYYHEVIGLNSTNLTVENGRDKCVHCVWEDAEKGVSRGFSSSCMLQGAYVGSSNDGDGGGGSFAAIELIGHLLFPVPPLRKSMFRKSMGSGDNGKPHKARTRRGHGNGPSQGSRTVLYGVSSLFVFCPQSERGCMCEFVLVVDVLERSQLNCIIMIFISNDIYTNLKTV